MDLCSFFFLTLGVPKVQCSDDLMTVDIILSDDKFDPSNIYLESLKGYPNQRCQPTIENHVARFELSLRDFHECGVTRMVYQMDVGFGFSEMNISQ